MTVQRVCPMSCFPAASAEDADFSDDLGFDSLDKVELWMDIENEFKIKIEEEKWEDLDTVNKLIKYLEDTL